MYEPPHRELDTERTTTAPCVDAIGAQRCSAMPIWKADLTAVRYTFSAALCYRHRSVLRLRRGSVGWVLTAAGPQLADLQS